MDPQGLMQLLQMLHAGGFGSKTPQGQLPAPGGAPPVTAPAGPPPPNLMGNPGQGLLQGMGMPLGGLMSLLGGQGGGGANGAPLAGAGLGGLAGMLMGGR